MKNIFLFLVLIALSTTAWAQKKVAIVKLLKGDVDVLTLGKTSKLKVDDWVEDGSVVKTAEKSFVKLVFIDKSQMNIGPSSEMKIEKFGEKDSGVIDLVKGKIRSQVTKDYLQMDRNKSKLFIKTPNAVMGVRGTDFLISTNGMTTSTVLFEGAIAFNRLENRGEVNSGRLEDIVDRGVSIHPGEFSVADQIHPLPTVPSVLNVQQREALEKNQNFSSDRTPGNSSASVSEKSIVPPGLSGHIVSNDTSTLKSEISSVATAPVQPPKMADAQGFVTADSIKPTNGSFLHVESGVIIPPPPGSVFDPVTNSYIPTGSAGTVSSTGDYLPPKNIEITSDGKVLVATVDPTTGQTVVTQTAAPAPVTSTTAIISSTTTTIGTFQTTSPTTTTSTTTTINRDSGILAGTNPKDPLPQSQMDIRNVNQIEQKTTTLTTINATQ
jgi:hypothetical protein